MTAGLLGRKSGRGFYRHENGKQEQIAEPPAPPARPQSVWVSRAGLGAKLADLVAKLGAPTDSGAKPAARSLCLVAPVGRDATSTAVDEGLDPARTLAVDCLLSLERRRTLMTTPVTAPAMAAAAHGLLSSDGVPISVIHDSPGFVAQRDARADRQHRLRHRAAAHRLARRHRRRGDARSRLSAGAARLGRLDRRRQGSRHSRGLQDFYGDPRYRASPWLKRRARLGVSLLTPEA
jgi:3-hydroxybutyryl-CoA dehydrogenase